jgi:hypothetical protein
MELTSIFAFCIAAQILSVSSHGSGHPGPNDIPHLEQTFMSGDFIDVTTDSQFYGLGTYANLPYVNCLSANNAEEGRYDIAILGAPFDTVSGLLYKILHAP